MVLLMFLVIYTNCISFTDDVAQPIPCVKCLLLGHLTVQPQRGSWLSVETTGTIFLEDNTAAIPLEVCIYHEAFHLLCNSMPG